jgi:uroporphyrinogen-III decarboxylase
MENTKKWADLSWKEKREERFKRWLSPLNAQFINPTAEKLYKARVTRYIKAIKMEEPDRVPVNLPTGNFPAYYSGINIQTIMYDYEAMKKAWIKYMDDFGDMDSFNAPSLIPSGKVTEALNSKTTLWPGHGLPNDAAMNQSVEGEYMNADEYALFLRDPSDFSLRTMLPRSTGLFESFKKLPPLRSLQGAAWISALADPDIRKTFETLMGLADEYKKWQTAYADVNKIVINRGYPTTRGSGFMAGAPFDHFADMLRGTRGISMDLRRQPEVLHEAMERTLEMSIANIKGAGMTNCPVVSMPLHKGDDTFMSDKQFEIFYWPYLRKLMMAMIEEGLVPMPFAEGKYTNRLKQIADTPRSGVVWYFDQTDMVQAKKILGNVSCIVGNVPTSIIMKGTPQDVKESCRKVIEICAPGGGYILAGGASVDKTTMANLKAMMDAAQTYGKYK